MKIKTGSQIPDISILTPDGRTSALSNIYKKNDHTLLLFLRYFGCTLCQLDLRDYAKAYAAFKEKKTEVIVVLQSQPETINASKADIPYIIACDPDQKLFKAFEITPAKNMLGMLSLKVFSKMKRAKAAGLEHGEYEGEEKQLPAAFLLDKAGKVLYARYAKNLTDLPSPAAFLEKV